MSQLHDERQRGHIPDVLRTYTLRTGCHSRTNMNVLRLGPSDHVITHFCIVLHTGTYTVPYFSMLAISYYWVQCTSVPRKIN